MANKLQFEKSPYLLEHKENPVDWFPWGEEAFEMARTEDRPIFLSIGYSTCHWCHVMGRESFADEKVAALLNRSFVSIKVDREERPDIDGVYMAACIAATGSGGWPLTILLDGEQRPFWAGTYLPKKQLLSLLGQVEQLWRENREMLLAAGDALTEYLQTEESVRGSRPGRELVDRAVERYARLFDPRWGGFGRAPKFPTPHNLIFLMRYSRCTGNGQAMAMAEQTLEGMYRGGLFDHVGGGFSRYSTDERWLVPHFEKMLYDNALLLFAYAEAFAQTGRPFCRQAACRIAAYALRELEAPEGGFFCGQDADSDGEEGKYYIFTPDEIKEVLGEDAKIFCNRYGITEAGNFEGCSIPNLIGQQEIDRDDGMDALRERVRLYRLERTHLHKDDKILTAWNGLMIAALARAGRLLGEETYLRAAERAAAFLEEKLTLEDGRVLARWRCGDGAINGKLEDYAFYAWGLLELYHATFRVSCLRRAGELARLLLDGFFDHVNGGAYPYSNDDEQLLTRKKEVYDGALPSGNAVAALVLSRLARLTGELQWREAADKQFFYLAGAVADHPEGYGFTMLAMLEELWPTAELLVSAERVPEELQNWLAQEGRIGLSVLVKTPEDSEELSRLAPFTANYPRSEGGPVYYLCRGGACQRPVTTLEEVENLL